MTLRTRGILIVVIAALLVATSFVSFVITISKVDKKAKTAESNLIAYVSTQSSSALLGTSMQLLYGQDPTLPKGIDAITTGPTKSITIHDRVSVLWESRCVTATREATGTVHGTTEGAGCP